MKMNKAFLHCILLILSGCYSPDKNKRKTIQNDTISYNNKSDANDSFLINKKKEDKQKGSDKQDEALKKGSIELIDLTINAYGIGNVKLGSYLPTISGSQKYPIKDTILQSEGVSWPAKVVISKKDERPLVLLEANWQDKDELHRVTVVDSLPEILKSNIKVGSKLGNIKKFLSNKIPDSPDGYLFLKLKEQKNIHLEFPYQNTFKGITLLEQIPDSLSVKSIVIMNRNR